jgi:hypothetical protein
LSLLRCTVVSSEPISGGDLVVEDTVFKVPELGIYFCLVSEHEHYLTEVQGDKPRIIWQFGFNVPAEDWNNFKIKAINYD